MEAGLKTLSGEQREYCRNCGAKMGLAPFPLVFVGFVEHSPEIRNGRDYRPCPRCKTLHEFRLDDKLGKDQAVA